MSAVTWKEQLERAIALARPRCRRCENDEVGVEWREGDGWIPVQSHFVYSAELYDSCPALHGGYAAWESHELLWAALETRGGLWRPEYGEASYSRRQLREAA